MEYLLHPLWDLLGSSSLLSTGRATNPFYQPGNYDSETYFICPKAEQGFS